MGIERRPLPKLTSQQTRTVKCPRCLAKAGDPCRNQFGKPVGSHMDRQRAAARSIRASRRRSATPLEAKSRAKGRTGGAQGRRQRDRSSTNPLPNSDTSSHRALSGTEGASPALAPPLKPAVGRGALPARNEAGRRVINADVALSRHFPKEAILRVPGLSNARQPGPASPPSRRVPRPAGERLLLHGPVPVPAVPQGLGQVFARATLTVEMIPEPLWGLSAKKTLPPRDWAALRLATLSEAGNRCVVCGGDGAGRPLQCHEQWMYDDEALVQTLVGLHALCEACHVAKTPGRAAWLASTDPRYSHLPEQILTRLVDLNGWARHVAVAYVAWSGAVNRERSRFTWTQNVSRISRATDEINARAEQVCPRCFIVVPLASVSQGTCDH